MRGWGNELLSRPLIDRGGKRDHNNNKENKGAKTQKRAGQAARERESTN